MKTNTSIYTGVVKFFNIPKGYGFIIEDGTNEEYFFHVSGMRDRVLQKNELVSYEIETTDRGKKAVNIKTI